MGYTSGYKDEEKVEAIGCGPTTLDRVQQAQAVIEKREKEESIAPLSGVQAIHNLFTKNKPLIESATPLAQKAKEVDLLAQKQVTKLSGQFKEAIDSIHETATTAQEIQTLVSQKEGTLNKSEKKEATHEFDIIGSMLKKAFEVEDYALRQADSYIVDADKEREKLVRYSKLQHLLESEQEKFAKKKEASLSPEVLTLWNELHANDSQIPLLQEKKPVDKKTFLLVLSHCSTQCEIIPSKIQSLMSRVQHTWNKSLAIIESVRRGMRHILDSLKHITNQTVAK
ncbi:MAG: hypothetical protein WCP39_01020 [Chlamydiota bacterium]